MYPHSITPRAWLILPGHRDAAARVRVVRYPFWARLWRTAALGAMWGIITLTAFLITVFDPFLSSIPLVLGSASVWRSWRGEFRNPPPLASFAGDTATQRERDSAARQ